VAKLGTAEVHETACPLGVCDGSGWIPGPEDVARPCECREQRIRRGRVRGISSVIPPRYRGVSFDRPPVTEIEPMVVRVVRSWAEDLDANLDAGRGLWLMGDTGTGKTTLAMAVSKASLEAGRSVAIYSLPKLLARIRRTYDAEPGGDSYLAFFERLGAVDLLHIDDLGAEKSSEWVLERSLGEICRHQDRALRLVSLVDQGVELLQHPVGALLGAEVVDVQQIERGEALEELEV
jgi:DNA replication protein DnaC